MRERPIFLNLFKIKLPLAGFISITHRISGIVFFLGFPLLVYVYQLLPVEADLLLFLNNIWVKLGIWSLVSLYVYHFFAGVRHMVADFGHDHSLETANKSAVAVLVLGVAFALYLGVVLW